MTVTGEQAIYFFGAVSLSVAAAAIVWAQRQFWKRDPNDDIPLRWGPPRPEIPSRCETCRFYKVPRCHVRPPTRHPDSGSAVWPLVSAFDWCGEYQLNEVSK